MGPQLFSHLRQLIPQLSKTERRIAQIVLERPEAVVDLTINEFAELCNTSPASIARFCQHTGHSGYRSFLTALATATSREQTTQEIFKVSDADINPEDSARDVVTKVAYQESRAIEETARALDLDALDRAVAQIRSAPRIEIFGVGSSGLAAQDLNQKLHRIGYTSFCWTDVHMALPSAALSTPGALAVGISHTGATLETHQVLSTAKESGAFTVALTNYPDSPLGRVADIVLTTSVRETRYRSGAMSSRIAQMAVVDFLTVRLLQGGQDQTNENLRRTYRAVEARRMPYNS